MNEAMELSIIETIRTFNAYQFAATALIAGITCDIPDGRERIENATNAAKNLYDLIDKRKNKEQVKTYKRMYDLGQQVLQQLDSAVEIHKIEWPIERK